MKINESVERMTKIQNSFLLYIDSVDNYEEKYHNFVTLLEDLKIRNNRYDLEIFLKLILQITNYHYRTANFFDKIDQVLSLFKDEMKQNYTNFEIFSLFQSNKRILLYLLDEKIMTIDKQIYNIMLNHKYTNFEYGSYFSPETRPFFIDEVNDDNYELEDMESLHGFLLFMRPMFKEAVQKNPDLNLPTDFYQNRKLGENESELCEVIRKDDIEKFIIYVNKNSLDLDGEIESSMYETNLLLLKCGPTTLIEYASFFGSVQIFKYLNKNGVKLKPSLWIFAIHGNNPELISILEEKHLKLHYDSYSTDNYYDSEDEKNESNEKSEDETEEESSVDCNDKNSRNQSDDDYSSLDEFSNKEFEVDEEGDFNNYNTTRERALEEAIKCHHNDIANYIIFNYIKKSTIKYNNDHIFEKNVNNYSFHYFNFDFFPKKFSQKFIFLYACQYGYYNIVKELMKTKLIKFKINIVSKLIFFSNDV